jgi:hypothetical protein
MNSYWRLSMFDFDGTLFRSWEATPEWWTEPGQFSFFIRPESLDEPCIPGHPGSAYWIKNAVSGAKEATSDSGTLAVLITGRVKVHAPRVKEVLNQVGIRFDDSYFNPGMSASSFKKNVLTDLITANPSITQVEIWENENQKVYKAHVESIAASTGRNIEAIVHSIHVPPIPLVCEALDFGMAARVASRFFASKNTVRPR